MMNTNRRRDGSPAVATASKRPRLVCSYGEDCYRRNPAHLREFSHPHCEVESILDNYSGTGDYDIPQHLIIQREMIKEQLGIIVEKKIYSPTTTQSVPTPSHSVNNTQDRDVSSENSTMAQTGDIAMKNTEPIARRVVETRPMKSQEKQPREEPTLAVKKEQPKEVKMEQSPAISQESKRNVSPLSALKGSSSSSKDSGGHADYRPVAAPTQRAEDHLPLVLPRGRSAAKHARSAPYHIFYTAIVAAKETHSQPNTITLLELLDRSLGELRCSLQINFMVDIGWLLAHYHFAGYRQKRLTVLYGEEMPDIATIGQKQPNVDTHLVTMATPFGKHHTKMMLLCYEDCSLRVVISTANLYSDDWENRTQGLWWSPACPELPEGAMPHEGDSETGFKRSLLAYLEHYRLPCLAHYVHRVRRCDMSHINVFLVASVPGGHKDEAWGMTRVAALLRRHCRVPPRDAHAWPLVAQASSIGSYGKEPRLWLTGDFHSKFCRARDQSALLSSTPPKLKLIYPSLENVQASHDGLLGGGCLPYSGQLHSKQPWLNQFLHQWRAVGSGRDRAMPHIKSYLRASPDYKQLAYYILTSANVSKAAWGTINKGDGALRIMSYEAGVLFLPQFVIKQDLFPLVGDDRLPLAYDLPPTLYDAGMTPWLMDYLHQ